MHFSAHTFAEFHRDSNLSLMSRWSWEGTLWKGKWSEPWQWKEQDDLSADVEELPPKLTLKKKNPWLTPTESCASGEAEEKEEKHRRAPLGLSDPVGEDAKRSDSRHELHGCQSDVSANAGNHLQPKYKINEAVRQDHRRTGMRQAK